MPDPRHGLGDATGVRSDPLALMARYYRAHLAKGVIRFLAKGVIRFLAKGVIRFLAAGVLE